MKNIATEKLLIGLRRLRPGRSSAGSDLSAVLVAQVRAARDGALLAQAMVNKEITPAAARVRVAEIEHRGDELRGEMVDRLGRTLVAPLDREDLSRLSRSIDDILDTIRDFVREADLYHIERRKSYQPILDSVVKAIESLGTAVESMWTKPKRVPLEALEARKAASYISREYQEEIAKIFDKTLTSQSLKQRELTGRLDHVAIRIKEAADVLTDGALKRGY